ncbi:MAG: DNA-directed RNA polymerase subunit RpoH/Rpb5 C-terminal domain-containing protein [Candidatus Micrarchaeaceae archaeon]
MKEERHFLVPLHRKLNEKEVGEVLKRLKAKKENLPKILDSDPQAKSLGAKVGDVIEITREELGTQYVYYRVVVKGEEVE